MLDKYRMYPTLEQVTPDSPRGLVWRAYVAEWCEHRKKDVWHYVEGTMAFTRNECAEQLAEVTES